MIGLVCSAVNKINLSETHHHFVSLSPFLKKKNSYQNLAGQVGFSYHLSGCIFNPATDH